MFANSANGPDCWKCSLHVEWHDCSWCPSISFRQGIQLRQGTATIPLPAASILPHPARRQNLAKPMKTIGNRKSGTGNSPAFTLVELLVVIAIIGILAGMLLPVLGAAKKRALIVKAKTEMADLAVAINAYDTDYGRFPISKDEQTWLQANGNGDLTTGLVFGPGPQGVFNNSNTVAILMAAQTFRNGINTANFNHVKNPRQVKYVTPKDAPDNTQGGVGSDGVYRDPWGNPYVITMNTSYNEQGTRDLLYCRFSVSQDSGQNGLNGLFNPVAPGNTDNFLHRGKVMIWSAGPDKTYDTGSARTGKNKDNVLSW
jgi:prepilin-type N-terminal cleavage/methylation domain-containing protein